MRLVAENLGGERNGEVLFSGLGFSVAAGEALLVTGLNGSGKSTLLRIIAGLLPPSEGSLQMEALGDEYGSIADAAHYIGHLNAMKPALTLRENLEFWRQFGGAGPGRGRRSIDDALDAVGLAGIDDLPFSYLSAGQKRRASIARLLVVHRPLWLLDEPTSSLDSQSEQRFGQLMRDHLGDGGLIVAATHLPLQLGKSREIRLGAEQHAS
ncbi:heme ABC exporter ATP-binding protein CcmA [Phyllobacterium sp. 21LDTY02-6]|uniref:heme ABC exporter ATP-binding protein CcmA n=1 Tax=unclassified Phyllobacterium TaxID=2638441 RepID=UPI0020215864|nr:MULTISPECIES: heme ABC exporter ATP-binding protein CcmA [unclassified Phyllobacterium]MCO4317366.1 heme ABC exporter ATP-binding protein CcmA [Phyllobacterium sp. 21LDTY02-6]MCX8293255.1 heme ABC exporter ATP-binding protein CcmA [Phyllobacterium sp. 0TCS1.6A]